MCIFPRPPVLVLTPLSSIVYPRSSLEPLLCLPRGLPHRLRSRFPSDFPGNYAGYVLSYFYCYLTRYFVRYFTDNNVSSLSGSLPCNMHRSFPCSILSSSPRTCPSSFPDSSSGNSAASLPGFLARNWWSWYVHYGPTARVCGPRLEGHRPFPRGRPSGLDTIGPGGIIRRWLLREEQQ